MQNSKIESLIHSMLTENTGVAMMDSGGDNGRMWQRNAGKTISDFKREAPVTIDVSEGEALYTVSTFHYLTSGIVELDDMCDEFNALPCKDWEGEVYGTSKAQEKWLKQKGFTFGESWNTYNGENNLSQVLQGSNLTIDGCGEGEYMLLQIHGGADVRGGYTDAKLVKLSRFQEFLNPCPDLSVTIDGVDLSLYGTDYVDAEGQSVTPTIKADSVITAELCGS